MEAIMVPLMVLIIVLFTHRTNDVKITSGKPFELESKIYKCEQVKEFK